MNDQPVIDALRAEVKRLGSGKSLAQALNISEQYVSDILNGRRNVSESVALSAGFRAMWVKRHESQEAMAEKMCQTCYHRQHYGARCSALITPEDGIDILDGDPRCACYWTGSAQPEGWVKVTPETMPRTGAACLIVWSGQVQNALYRRAGIGFACAGGYEWRRADDDEADAIPDAEVEFWKPRPCPPAAEEERSSL